MTNLPVVAERTQEGFWRQGTSHGFLIGFFPLSISDLYLFAFLFLFQEKESVLFLKFA
jgi:hypothetical protein